MAKGLATNINNQIRRHDEYHPILQDCVAKGCKVGGKSEPRTTQSSRENSKLGHFAARLQRDIYIPLGLDEYKVTVFVDLKQCSAC